VSEVEKSFQERIERKEFQKPVDMYAPFVSMVLRFRTYCALPTFNS
jgi:hypothetical protein